MVSAFAARQRLVLGQVKVAEKSNEVPAIPKLLDMVAIEGATATIDAMGCQRGISQKVIDKKADYVFALRGNQGSLCDGVELYATEQKAKDFADTKIGQTTTVNGDHGRVERRRSPDIETRTTTVIHDVKWLQGHHWPGLKSVVIVKTSREISGRTEQETRYYVTSLVTLAALMGPVVRSHWAIENSLRRVMGMVFRDDESRVRTDHAPANFTTIKHMAPDPLRRPPGKQSLRGRRKAASWDDDLLASLLTA